MNYLMNKAASSKANAIEELQGELNHRRIVDAIFSKFANDLELNVSQEVNENIQFECLRNSVNHYKLQCQNFSEYTLKYVKYLSAGCKRFSEEFVKSTIDSICIN